MQRSLLLLAALAAPLSAQQTAWLVDSDLDLLFSVDLNTGATTLIGSTLTAQLATPADLCWRDDTDEIYTIDLATPGTVGTLDRTTAAFTPMFQTSLGGWQAMAWDAAQKVFWLHNQSGSTYRLDPATGVTTLVGTLSPNTLVTALEVDAGGTLYAIAFSTGAIFRIDKSTGVQTSGATTAPTSMQGLNIAADGTWYAVNTTTDSLYRIDPLTGATTLVGANPGTQFAKGFCIAGTAVQRGGTACPDGNNERRHMQWTGASNLGGLLQLGVEQGTVPTPVTLMIGLSASRVGAIPLPLDLGPFGMPGCRLQTSPDTLFGIVSGFNLPLPIPNLPGLVGFVVHAQGAVFDIGAPPANSVGLVFSDLARVVITP